MSKLVHLNLHPDARILRQFGVAAFCAFGLLSMLAWSERGVFAFGLGGARLAVASVLLAIAGSSLLLGWLYPPGNRWLYLGLTFLTYPLGFVLSYVVLGILFFGVIAPIALLLRALGRDPVERAVRKNAATYWTPARKPRATHDYFSQF